MKRALKLLEESFEFISRVKCEEGEGVDPDNLENEIISYLEEIKQDLIKIRDYAQDNGQDVPF
jgi:hypothetical protein